MGLERYAGYWSLVVFSIELWSILATLRSLTGARLFDRWLRRCSWLLPVLLYLAYRGHSLSLDPRSIHTFGDYNLFMTRLFIRDTEILAAHFIPHLTLALLILVALHIGLDQIARGRPAPSHSARPTARTS